MTGQSQAPYAPPRRHAHAVPGAETTLTTQLPSVAWDLALGVTTTMAAQANAFPSHPAHRWASFDATADNSRAVGAAPMRVASA